MSVSVRADTLTDIHILNNGLFSNNQFVRVFIKTHLVRKRSGAAIVNGRVQRYTKLPIYPNNSE